MVKKKRRHRTASANKNARRVRPKLTKAQVKHREGKETLEQIEQRMRTPADAHEKPKTLMLADIHVAHAVFQWRLRDEDIVKKTDHIYDMACWLIDHGKPLRVPPLVFAVGKRAYVIDGHHRLDAYLTAKWNKPVPVRWFAGTLREARLAGMQGNSETKLPMTKRDKSEGAWRIVKERWPDMSIGATAGATGVSQSTVSNMRAVRDQLRDDPSVDGERLKGLTWERARMVALGVEEFEPDGEWQEKAARKMADALLKAKIGQGFMKHPDITARALEMINTDLPEALLWNWYNHHELRDMLDEEGESEAHQF